MKISYTLLTCFSFTLQTCAIFAAATTVAIPSCIERQGTSSFNKFLQGFKFHQANFVKTPQLQDEALTMTAESLTDSVNEIGRNPFELARLQVKINHRLWNRVPLAEELQKVFDSELELLYGAGSDSSSSSTPPAMRTIPVFTPGIRNNFRQGYITRDTTLKHTPDKDVKITVEEFKRIISTNGTTSYNLGSLQATIHFVAQRNPVLGAQLQNIFNAHVALVKSTSISAEQKEKNSTNSFADGYQKSHESIQSSLSLQEEALKSTPENIKNMLQSSEKSSFLLGGIQATLHYVAEHNPLLGKELQKVFNAEIVVTQEAELKAFVAQENKQANLA